MKNKLQMSSSRRPKRNVARTGFQDRTAKRLSLADEFRRIEEEARREIQAEEQIIEQQEQRQERRAIHQSLNDARLDQLVCIQLDPTAANETRVRSFHYGEYEYRRGDYIAISHQKEEREGDSSPLSSFEEAKDMVDGGDVVVEDEDSMVLGAMARKWIKVAKIEDIACDEDKVVHKNTTWVPLRHLRVLLRWCETLESGVVSLARLTQMERKMLHRRELFLTVDRSWRHIDRVITPVDVFFLECHGATTSLSDQQAKRGMQALTEDHRRRWSFFGRYAYDRHANRFTFAMDSDDDDDDEEDENEVEVDEVKEKVEEVSEEERMYREATDEQWTEWFRARYIAPIFEYMEHGTLPYPVAVERRTHWLRMFYQRQYTLSLDTPPACVRGPCDRCLTCWMCGLRHTEPLQRHLRETYPVEMRDRDPTLLLNVYLEDTCLLRVLAAAKCREMCEGVDRRKVTYAEYKDKVKQFTV